MFSETFPPLYLSAKDRTQPFFPRGVHIIVFVDFEQFWWKHIIIIFVILYYWNTENTFLCFIISKIDLVF